MKGPSSDVRHAYLHQPREVAIETLALCNARCTFCPYPTLERQGTRMSDALLGRLLEELSTYDHPFWFTPFKLNEPLLEPRFERIMETVETTLPNAWLRLFTNGQALTDKKAEIVAGMSRVEHLWVSLNETDPDKYQQLMGLDWHKTVRRLDALHESSFPHKVVISRVGNTDPDFHAYVHARWPKFESFVITKAAWIDFTDPEYPAVPSDPCGRWWEINVMADGKVSLCCQDYDGRHAIGDVNHQTIMEVYNTWFYKERRQKLLDRRIVPVCQTCSYG